MRVRQAQLDDAAGISEIHRSHVGRWYRRLGAEQFDVPYERLSPGERWGFGGPWMSVETCAVHLNNLLLQRQFPFVAQEDDHIAGEMELFEGNEGSFYGKNLHIGLLYIRKSDAGRGIGTALVDKAVEFAGRQGCDTVTVSSHMANVGFYERHGFGAGSTLVELEAISKAYDVDLSPIDPPLNLWSFTRGLPMRIGRNQSSAFHVFEQLDMYAIPEFLACRRERVFVNVNGYPSMFAFTRYESSPGRADVCGWSGADIGEATMAAMTLLHARGVEYANILLPGDDYNAMADRLDAAIKGARGSLLIRRT